MEQKNSEVVLDVENLTVQFVVENIVCEAVSNVSFQLKRGEAMGLVGETGAGKTTTALAILNLISSPPGVIQNGKIIVCGHDILQMKPDKLSSIRGNDVSMIFQDPMTALNPVMTVGEQIAESIFFHQNCSRAEAFQKAEEMLETVGIPKNRANEYPHQFPGGMKQRVVIAIALACNPKLLLADEPTTALDVTIQAQILKLMKDLRSKYGTSLIMISHDLGIVAEICDKVAVMYAGRIIEFGTLEEVFTKTKHPYTEGLFNSLPNINDRKSELKPIPGLMPDPTNLPEYCAFEPRCPYATPLCGQGKPVYSHFSDTHVVLCKRYEEAGFSIERGRKNG